MNDLASRYRVIDIDTHVIEPYDLWTSRVSAKRFGDRVPHVRRDEKGKDYWFFGGRQTIGAANFAQAGYREWSPSPPDTLEHFGQPRLTTAHWDRLWAAAQDMEMVVNFHIGSGNNDPLINLLDSGMAGVATAAASQATLMFIGNAKAVVQLIGGGICHRFPRLNFVSVESGVGWVPFIIGALDWQWRNSNVWEEHPDWLTPLEYFQRQIYASFWFEQPETLHPAIEYLGCDNILYETDFPHPTSMSTGPCSAAMNPRDYIEEVFRGLPETTAAKILHDNAARIYHIT